MAEVSAKSGSTNQPIRFQVPTKQIPSWYGFIRRGFRSLAPSGQTVRHILCGHFGVDPEYLDNRVQTLFINGQPVDDVDRTVVAPGDELSLSAAMPGLAGASLRKGGHLAAFRDSISYVPHSPDKPSEESWITIKLFNFVSVELGPLFLEHGLQVRGQDLVDFLRQNQLSLTDSQTKVSCGQQALTLGELSDCIPSQAEWVDIQVTAA
jgi:hypothetical protein